jgi:hypothetical protein
MKISLIRTFLTSSLISLALSYSINTQHGNAQVVNQENSHTQQNSQNNSPQLATQVKLSIPVRITLSEPTSLTINVQDGSGQPITNFDLLQAKLMHLIVVNDSLTFFSNVHPIYQGNGRFVANVEFPSIDSYVVFTDYKPAKQSEQVAVLKFAIPGKITKLPEVLLFDNVKSLDGVEVSFSSSVPTIKSGHEVILTFDLTDSNNNQPINLETSLGEKGHLVIIRSSSNLTTSDYVHARTWSVTSIGQMKFLTRFPQPGKYKLWIEFNRKGKVDTADFWVNVE